MAMGVLFDSPADVYDAGNKTGAAKRSLQDVMRSGFTWTVEPGTA